MQASSSSSSSADSKADSFLRRRCLNERRRRTIKGRARRHWLLFLQIWMLSVALAISETAKLMRRADKNSIAYSGVGKSPRNFRDSRSLFEIENEDGNINVELELKIPFLSLPIGSNNKTAPGSPLMSLVKLNTRGLAYFVVLMAMLTYVLPVILTKVPEHAPNFIGHHPYYAKEHKRSDRGLELPSFGNSLNDILDKNINIGPCTERLVCSVVATAKHADEPTSLDVIIDSLFSLFEETVNGTMIKEAAEKGRQVLSAEDCVITTSECILNQKILLNVLKMIGL